MTSPPTAYAPAQPVRPAQTPESAAPAAEPRGAPVHKVGFLYNHDAPHQIAHSAPIARELARHQGDIEVHIIASSDALLNRARDVIAPSLETPPAFHLLPPNRLQNVLGKAFDNLGPFSRLANLFRHREFLATFDTLVVPERTTLFLRRMLGARTPRLVCTRHGSGDRSVGFKASAKGFDLVLFSGPKTRDRFVASGILKPAQTAIVGYPKFDSVNTRQVRRLFDNDRPTVVYNPNPDARLSSFYGMGLDVLEHFYRSDRYNLVFAPHMMLFRRKIHVSLESYDVRIRPNIPERYLDCPHIRVDLGSPALLDMTYTLAADIYMGDVSSQVYEFIKTPRPCVFLNPSRLPWQGDPDFLFWTMGPVVTGVNELDAAIARAGDPAFMARQKEMFAHTFALTAEPSSHRAARAIRDFVTGRGEPADMEES